MYHTNNAVDLSGVKYPLSRVSTLVSPTVEPKLSPTFMLESSQYLRLLLGPTCSAIQGNVACVSAIQGAQNMQGESQSGGRVGKSQTGNALPLQKCPSKYISQAAMEYAGSGVQERFRT